MSEFQKHSGSPQKVARVMEGNSGCYRDLLFDAYELSVDRKEQYGDDTYKQFAKIMREFFPNGVKLNSEGDLARYNYFSNVIGKLCRYAKVMESGGHKDSAVDGINYMAMLAEVTNDHKNGGGQ